MNPSHFIVSPETAWGTWVTPAQAILVDNFSYAVKRNRNRRHTSGSTRAPVAAWLMDKEVTGSVELPAWSEMLGLFFKAAQLTNVTSTQPDSGGAPTAYDHAFLPDDADAAVVTDALSIQAQWSSSIGVNILGAAIDKLTLSCAVGEPVTLSADFMALDEALAGGTWESGDASPALVATPTYFSRAIKPLIFTGAALVMGGTPSLDPTSKQYSISGGTEVAKLRSLEWTLENGLDAGVFLGDPTPGLIAPGERAVSFSFERDQAVIDSDFYAEYRAGTQTALQLTFLGDVIGGAVRRGLVITMPLVDFDGADWPEIGGDKGRKARSISGVAVDDPTTGYDLGVTVTDTQTGY